MGELTQTLGDTLVSASGYLVLFTITNSDATGAGTVTVGDQNG